MNTKITLSFIEAVIAHGDHWYSVMPFGLGRDSVTFDTHESYATNRRRYMASRLGHDEWAWDDMCDKSGDQIMLSEHALSPEGIDEIARITSTINPDFAYLVARVDRAIGDDLAIDRAVISRIVEETLLQDALLACSGRQESA